MITHPTTWSLTSSNWVLMLITPQLFLILYTYDYCQKLTRASFVQGDGNALKKKTKTEINYVQ